MRKRHETAEYKIIIQLLSRGLHLDKYQVAQHTGTHHRTAGRYIKEIRKRESVYVSRWRQTKHAGPWHPVIAFGKEKDASKPSAKEKSERRSVRASGISIKLLLGVRK